jgi:hypothetical protein
VHPVLRPQLVQDGAPDALHGVGLELETALGLELLDRVREPEDAGLDEIGDIDMRRETSTHTTGDVLDQRRVVQHQPVAQREIVRAAVLPPEGDDARLDLVGRPVIPGQHTIRLPGPERPTRTSTIHGATARGDLCRSGHR